MGIENSGQDTGAGTDPVARSTMDFLQDLLGEIAPRDFSVRLWDGTLWPAATSERFTLVINHPGAPRRMFWPPGDLTLGEAYIYRDFDVEGDLEAAFTLGERLSALATGQARRLIQGLRLLQLPAAPPRQEGRGPAHLAGAVHSPGRDRAAIAYHYDVSNDFYALWLDRRLVYSCAYFATPSDDLDLAQERKLDYICRKLRLAPGQRLLDIGCGWGGLVLHAAQRYGVEALGITLSEPQAAYARQRIAGAGLGDRCRVEVRDYRELEAPGGFDRLVSVGMFEHVGEARLPEYFSQAFTLLRPGGVFLNHGIARRADEEPKPGPSFVDRYVFPDGELLPISTTLHHAEAAGFEIRDVESLREHYALTLRHWVRRLVQNAAAARDLVDDTTFRTWWLFMTGSAHGFATGRLNVYQTLMVRSDGGASGLPLIRADWYAASSAGCQV